MTDGVVLEPYRMDKRRANGIAKTTLRQTSLRLDNRDRAAVKAIVDAGWAKNTADAIRYALKVAADRVAA